MPVEALKRYSEPYSRTGNIGENLLRLLGTPALDPLQTVIREAVQNIADAAKLGSGPRILIRLRTLSDEQREALGESILRDLPPELGSCEKISGFLDCENPVVMEICDFGTTGLGGPTRSDRIPSVEGPTDFIDFVRNIGTPRDSPHGGGTYGFGKVSLYRASRCATILVDSLVAGGGSGSRRFIGCHVGASFGLPDEDEEMQRRYTGRHWWGINQTEDNFVEPALDERAAGFSRAVGFPRRNPAETGTSIMILDFDLQGEDIGTAGQRIAEALLWNFWPRMMLDAGPARRFECRVEVDGRDIALPPPEEFPVLELFSKAMRAARNGSRNGVQPIKCRKPIKTLGHLAIERGLRVPREPLVHTNSLFPDVCNHIAVMRPVELVVKYIVGQPLPGEHIEWAGVFLTSDENDVERAFADSEPPAHDDWVPDNLAKGPAKTYVNVALRELNRHAFEMGNPPRREAVNGTSGPPLAQVAGLLGRLLAGTSGDGAGALTGGRGGGGRRPRRARASRPLFARLEGQPDEPVAVFETEVRQDDRKSGSILRTRPAVAVDGVPTQGLESIGLQPKVASIAGPTPELSSNGGQVALGGNEGRFEIRVRCPPDSAVTLEAEVLPDIES